MGYTLNRGTISWARKREQQLREAEISIGLAMDALGGVPQDLKDGALLMEEQPESDVMRSFADDVTKLHADLKKRLTALIKDKNALGKAILNYEKLNRDDRDW